MAWKHPVARRNDAPSAMTRAPGISPPSKAESALAARGMALFSLLALGMIENSDWYDLPIQLELYEQIF